MKTETACTLEQFAAADAILTEGRKAFQIKAAALDMHSIAAQIRATIPKVEAQAGKVANKRAFEAIRTPRPKPDEPRPAYWVNIITYGSSVTPYISIYPDMQYSRDVSIMMSTIREEGKQPRIDAATTVAAMKEKADSLEAEADSINAAVYTVPAILERLQAFQKAIEDFNALPAAVRKAFKEEAITATGYRNCGLYY